ncbi:MAG: chain length determinant protein EpsF [Acidobacteriota bacterium]
MSFKQFLAVIRARWLIVLIISMTLFTIVLVASLAVPKQYTSVGSVVIDVKSPDPLNGLVMPGGYAQAYIATQIDIIRSERVSKKVIDALRLRENPQLRQQWQDATKGQGVFDTWLSEILQKKLDILPAKDSTVITVAYTAADPNFAAAMANAFIQAYLDTAIELRVEPAKRFTALFEEQSRMARARLEKAQAQLSDYQRQNGLVANDERLDIENARLAELSTQLVAMQALMAESSSRKAQAGNSSIEVLNNPVVAGLKADLSRQEARLKELNARLGNQHPQVIELQANINELQAKIDTETQRVKQSVGINNSVNESRVGQVRAALEAQREKILKLKQTRDQAAVLMADVENAQKAYDILQARYSQTSLESRSDQGTVSILKVPTPPADASFPRVILFSVAALFFGLMLGVAAAMGREMSDRKLRSEDDIIATLDAPFMGVMPFAAEANRDRKAPVGLTLRIGKRGGGGMPELMAPSK